MTKEYYFLGVFFCKQYDCEFTSNACPCYIPIRIGELILQFSLTITPGKGFICFPLKMFVDSHSLLIPWHFFS